MSCVSAHCCLLFRADDKSPLTQTLVLVFRGCLLFPVGLTQCSKTTTPKSFFSCTATPGWFLDFLPTLHFHRCHVRGRWGFGGAQPWSCSTFQWPERRCRNPCVESLLCSSKALRAMLLSLVACRSAGLPICICPSAHVQHMLNPVSLILCSPSEQIQT